MPFIGNQLSTSFQNVETQTITGDGSTSYTLNNAVADGKDLLVYINNVKQEEGSGKSYTATGTTITFTEAVASTDSCYVVFIGQAIGTVTPKDGSIVSSMLADANLEMPNTLDLNGKELILDADADTSITADTDDTIDIKIAGSDVYQITATKVDLNGKELVLDADADTSITADTDDQIDFKTGGSDRLIIDGIGDLGVGVSPESDHYSAYLNINFGLTGLLGSASSGTNATFLTNNAYLNTSANWIYKEADEATKYNQVSGAHIWEYAGSGSAGATISFSEAMRIDSSGNVLVGKTSTGDYVAGFEVQPAGAVVLYRSSGVAGLFGRTDNGEILRFNVNSATVGKIGTESGGKLQINSSANNNLMFAVNGSNYVGVDTVRMYPENDNNYDLGLSSSRYDDIFATNGTIQTSDQNEKQDIASATAKELNVAKKLSALFKTFRWKDKVGEKGDKARTHTGIVAQEVQLAFKEEGLDASNYGLFTSDTWTNDDGKEQTRLGVRYPELFSFIFSSIEARLTALEAK